MSADPSGPRTRPRGCAGCLAFPFVLAARVFRPAREDRVVDAGIEAAQIGRTAIGVVASLWLLYAYPLREDPSAVFIGKLGEVILSAGVLIVAGPVAMTVFVLCARPPLRRVYRGRVHEPLRAIGAFFGTGAVFVFVISGGVSGVGMGVFLALPVFLFSIPFGIAGALLAVHYVFRTADVHEVLPPLVSPALVWAMFVFQLFDEPPVVAPAAVRAVFLVVPPLSVTALSLWELRRLRTGYGITVRGALGRERRVRRAAGQGRSAR
ncbi:hypothetical protein GCM10009801_26940 [Streptomyces albiaxialis]|uniref:ABC transporter permease n=1 Tax=Streptomyces albiaxialis TaxID=329523 RepID=A0ABN2VUV6_9ACTN